MRKVVAMVLAGGRVEELSVLTFSRPKAAVAFGGAYRIIDFALSNLANTDVIENVGILSQYKPSSLIDHVGIGLPWDFVGTKRGVRILPPYTGPERSSWYRGTADALYQNIDFLELHRPDDVLIVSGDHVYNMDYTSLLRFHIERGADMTMGVTPQEVDPSRFGIAEINAEGQILGYAEKPKNPRSNLASMTVYAFRCDVLIEELRRHAEQANAGEAHLWHQVLPRMVSRRRAYAWVHYGAWEYVRTLDSYFQVNQQLLGDSPRIDLLNWNVRTNTMTRRAAPLTASRHLPGALVTDSIVSGGCEIAGTVDRSVLSPDVHIGKGAIVRNSILWEDVVVEEGAVLDHVICDKRCVIGKGAHVGVGDDMRPNAELATSLTCGVTVLGMDAHVPEGAEIGRNCIIYPHAGKEQLGQGPVASGSTVLVARPVPAEVRR